MSIEQIITLEPYEVDESRILKGNIYRVIEIVSHVNQGEESELAQVRCTNNNEGIESPDFEPIWVTVEKTPESKTDCDEIVAMWSGRTWRVVSDDHMQTISLFIGLDSDKTKDFLDKLRKWESQAKGESPWTQQD